MEVVGSEGKKVIWEAVDNSVVAEATDHDEIGLRGFNFNLFDEYEKGVIREVLSDYTYLLMLKKLWSGDWKNNLNRKDHKVDEDNWKAIRIRNGRYRKVCHFSDMNFGRTLVFSFQILPLVLGDK